MPDDLWTDVDRYIDNVLVRPDRALQEALDSTRAAGLPAISVAPNQGKLLYILARATGARRILEIGTLAGYSTIWLARALPPGGFLLSLEAEPRHAEIARANLERAGLARVVEVRVGAAQATLPQLVAERADPFDLTFIDADKPGYPAYLRWALDLSRPGSLIIADNVVRDGKIIDAASRDSNVQAIREFNEVLAVEPRLTATVLQTVGVKGYDGLAIALVT